MPSELPAHVGNVNIRVTASSSSSPANELSSDAAVSTRAVRASDSSSEQSGAYTHVSERAVKPVSQRMANSRSKESERRMSMSNESSSSPHSSSESSSPSAEA